MSDIYWKHEIRCLLFDLDGTLVDTTDLIIFCYQQSIKEHTGRNIPKEELFPHIKKSPVKVLKMFGVSSLSRYWKHYDLNYQKAVLYDPNLLNILSELEKTGVKLSVVSSLSNKRVFGILEQLSLLDFFKVVIGYNDTQRKKPHPDPILKALELLGYKPENTAYVGDTETDMIAAQNAKVLPLLVSWGDQYQPRNKTNIKIIKNFRDLITIIVSPH